MAYDFPNSPTVGQVSNGYTWDGVAWNRVTSAAAFAVISVGDVPPATPTDNQMWWESDTGYLFLYYVDANTKQWVQMNSQPGSIGEAPLDGQTYGRMSGGWVVVAGGGGGGGISEAPTDGSVYLRQGSTTSWAKGVPAGGGAFTGPVGMNQGLTVLSVNASTYSLTANGNYAGLGGLLGYGANNATYAISGYGGYSIYCSGPSQFTRLQCSDCAFTVATTSSSPTAYLSTSGGLFRSTSSELFKREIEPLQPEYADKVLALKTIFYRPNEKTVDPQDWSRFGFVTEDAYEVDFRFTSCSHLEIPIIEQQPHPANQDETIPVIVGYQTSEEAPPSDIDLKAIVACLLDVVRRQGDRITALEAAHGV